MSDYIPDHADDPGEAHAPRAVTGVRDVPRTSFPWPPREGDSVVSAFGRTWKGASLSPAGFFARLPERGSLGAALLYYLAIGIAIAGVQLFWSMVGGAAEPAREVTVGSVDSALALNPLVNFLVSPIFLLASLFLSAAVVHGMLKLLGAVSGDYLFTTRLFCFTYSPQIVAMVPGVGTIIGFIWMVAVAIAGVRAAHRTSTARAAIAVLVPVTIALIFVGLVFLAARAQGILDIPV